MIHVRRALNRQRQEVQPKTPQALREVVLMPALVGEALAQHRDRSRFREPDGYVFTTGVGTPLHWANISARDGTNPDGTTN